MEKSKRIDAECCALCGKSPVQIHHIFFGTANRKLADEDGLIIPLCLEHHLGKRGVHHDHELDLILKRKAQAFYEKTHTREDFIRRYGRSFL